MTEKDSFWREYGWITRGKQRTTVITELTDRPVTAQEFRKKLNAKLLSKKQLSLREISRHFTSFTKKGLMKCLTPAEPYGRLYSLTERGTKIQKELLKEKP